MDRTITIDTAGRLVIPKDVRRRHRLHAGARIRLVEQDGRIVLEPLVQETILIDEDGFRVVGGELQGVTVEAHTVHDERAEQHWRGEV